MVSVQTQNTPRRHGFRSTHLELSVSGSSLFSCSASAGGGSLTTSFDLTTGVSSAASSSWCGRRNVYYNLTSWLKNYKGKHKKKEVWLGLALKERKIRDDKYYKKSNTAVFQLNAHSRFQAQTKAVRVKYCVILFMKQTFPLMAPFVTSGVAISTSLFCSPIGSLVLSIPCQNHQYLQILYLYPSKRFFFLFLK